MVLKMRFFSNPRDQGGRKPAKLKCTYTKRKVTKIAAACAAKPHKKRVSLKWHLGEGRGGRKKRGRSIFWSGVYGNMQKKKPPGGSI